MSHVLSDLLGAKEPTFTFALERLESLSGHPNVDVRLVTDVERVAKEKFRQLGLDPQDTTEQELYHALQALTHKHDTFLAQALGGKKPLKTNDLLIKIKDKVETLPLPRRVWVIKHAVAKRLLKTHAPRRVMRLLGYKSVDSMLKRENIEGLFAASRFAESSQWFARLSHEYKYLQPRDFELRDVVSVDFLDARWQGQVQGYVSHSRQNIILVPEMGVVGLLPLPHKETRGLCITLLPLLIQSIHEMRCYSAFFKLQQVKPGFGERIAETLRGDEAPAATMASQPVPWRVLHHYFGRNQSREFPEVFDPHLQLEDLAWRRAEEVLFTIEPALKFWEGTGHIGWSKHGQPVSLNLLDNAVNYCNNLPFEKRTLLHFRSGLWHELLERYLDQEIFTTHVLRQLDEELVSSDEPLALAREGL